MEGMNQREARLYALEIIIGDIRQSIDAVYQGDLPDSDAKKVIAELSKTLDFMIAKNKRMRNAK